MDTCLIQIFFLIHAESLLISIYNKMVKRNSDSTDFHLLQTSLSVPTMLDTKDKIEITTTAGVLMQP